MIKESLFAAEERQAKLDKLGVVPQLMEQHVDFNALAAAIDRAAPRPDPGRGGRPPFPTELMVRVLVLQQRYSLSDEQMEYQLLDRLSFQRFAGLRHSSQIPDRTTPWTFRERLSAVGASEAIFVPAPVQHNRPKEKELIKAAGWRLHIQRKVACNSQVKPIPSPKITPP